MLKKKGNILIARAEIDSSTINAEAKTFDVVFATENPVLRSPWWSDESFFEVLVCDKKCMRTERLDAGVVPLLDTHTGYSIMTQYGIVRNWSIKAGECRATIEYSTQEAKADMWGDIEKKIIRSISVGAKIHQYERVPNSDPKKTPTYRAVDWEVTEISLAPVPLDYKSSTRAAEGEAEHEIEIINYNIKRSVMLTKEQMKHIRTSVRAAGLDEDFADDLIHRAISEADAAAEIAAEVSKRAETNSGSDALTQADVQRAITEERERGTAIRTAVRTAKLGEEFADELIARSEKGKPLTLDAARAAILDKMADNEKINVSNGGQGGARAMGDEKTHVVNAMIEGMMQRAQPGSVERYYKLEPREGEKYEIGRKMDVKAHDYKHMSFIDISRALLTLNGVPGVMSMSKDEVAKRAISTTDLPDLFTSNIDRFMRLNYEAIVPDWMRFATHVPADDFRVKTGIKFDAAVTFEEIAEDGEYKESNLMSNEKATIQLKTFGRAIGITRKTIINDDKGVLTDWAKFVGLGYRQFQSKRVWALITSNATCPDGVALFHATHGNLATGAAASAISDAALNAGTVAMSRQKSPQNNELDIVPAYLLCPPELINTAKKFLKGINPTKTIDVNLWEFLEPIKNVYLTDTKAWYLIANPANTSVDGIVYSNLTGQEGMYTESYVDPKTDKIMIKSRSDFETAMWGHQGWYKNVGKDPVAGV